MAGPFDVTPLDQMQNAAAGTAYANVGQTLAQTGLIQQQQKQTAAATNVLQQEAGQVQAQTQNLQAQQQGLIADSATKARGLAGQMWYGANANQWTTTDPQTGAQTVNYPKLMGLASAAGYGDIVPKLTQPFMDSVKSSIANATSQQDLQVAQAKAATQGASMIAMAAIAADKQKPGSGPVAYENQYNILKQTLPPAVMAAIPTPANYNPKILPGMVNAGLTPVDQANIQNQTTQAQAAQTNAATSLKQQQMSAGQAYIAGTNDSTQSGLISEAAKGLEGQNIPSSFIGRGMEGIQQYVTGNPALANADRQMKILNQELGTNMSWSQGVPAVEQFLNQRSQFLNARGQAYLSTASTGGFIPPEHQPTSVIPTEGTPTNTVNSKTSVPGATVQVSKGGKTIMVTPADAIALESHGWTKQ